MNRQGEAETGRRGDTETGREGDEVAVSPSRLVAPFLFSGLSRSAIIIGLVSLLSDISGEMIYPILPLFLTETLHAPATVVGLIEGIAVGASTAIGGLSRWLSDPLRRRKTSALAGDPPTAGARPPDPRAPISAVLAAGPLCE